MAAVYKLHDTAPDQGKKYCEQQQGLETSKLHTAPNQQKTKCGQPVSTSKLEETFMQYPVCE